MPAAAWQARKSTWQTTEREDIAGFQGCTCHYKAAYAKASFASAQPDICTMSRNALRRRNAPLQRGMLVPVPSGCMLLEYIARVKPAFKLACTRSRLVVRRDRHHVGSAIGGSAGACIPKGAGGERMYHTCMMHGHARPFLLFFHVLCNHMSCKAAFAHAEGCKDAAALAAAWQRGGRRQGRAVRPTSLC